MLLKWKEMCRKVSRNNKKNLGFILDNRTPFEQYLAVMKAKL